MKQYIKQKIKTEMFWLAGIGVAAAAAEYAFVSLLDWHPALGIQIQGFIGLLIIAYGIRMMGRIWSMEDTQERNSQTNGPVD